MYSKFREGQKLYDNHKKQWVNIIFVRNTMDVQPVGSYGYSDIYGVKYDEAVAGRLTKNPT